MRFLRLWNIAGRDVTRDKSEESAPGGTATGGPRVSGPARVVVAGKRTPGAVAAASTVSRSRLMRDTAAVALIGAAGILLVAGGGPLFGLPRGQVLEATGAPSAEAPSTGVDAATPDEPAPSGSPRSVAGSPFPSARASTVLDTPTTPPTPTTAPVTPGATAVTNPPAATPTASPSPARTPTPTPRPTPSRTPRPTSTPTATPTVPPTPTPTELPVPTPTLPLASESPVP